jgi:hypothetical protein
VVDRPDCTGPVGWPAGVCRQSDLYVMSKAEIESSSFKEYREYLKMAESRLKRQKRQRKTRKISAGGQRTRVNDVRSTCTSMAARV